MACKQNTELGHGWSQAGVQGRTNYDSSQEMHVGVRMGERNHKGHEGTGRSYRHTRVAEGLQCDLPNRVGMTVRPGEK